MRPSSIEAHEAIKPDKERQYGIILQAMRDIGKPAISKVIAMHSIGLDYHAVARRLSEMEKKEMIKVVGRDWNTPKRPLLWSIAQLNEI